MSSSPAISWSRLVGGADYDVGYSVAVGADGAVYVSGSTNGRIFDGLVGSGSWDAFITRYNPDGSKAWTNLLASAGASATYGHAVTANADGTIYIAGMTNSLTLDGQTNLGSMDGFISRLNSDGVTLWTRLVGSTKDDYVSSVTTSADGSVYVAGCMTNNIGMADGFISRYNSDGSQVWTKLTGGFGADRVTGVITCPDGGIYVAGQTYTYSNGSYIAEGFISRYNDDGDLAWTQLIAGSGNEFATSVSTGADGAVYLVGITYSVSLDGQINNSGNEVGFITRYNSDGSKAWTRLLGGSGEFRITEIRQIDVGPDGEIFVTGITSCPTLDGQLNNGNIGVFVTCYSPEGNKAWTKMVGGIGEGTGFFSSVTTDAVGAIYVAGTNTSTTWDGQPISGQADGFLIKLAPYHLPKGVVTVTGAAKIGQTLTASNTLTDADGLGTISYEWMADGQVIGGATVSSFTITQAQLGKAITVVANYTDGSGTPERVTSNSLQVANYNTAAVENSKTVTTLVVADALLGTAPKYTLSGADASLFKVSSKGVLTFAAVKDYEQPIDANKDGIYEVSVTLTNAKTGYRVVRDLTVGIEFVPINGTVGADTLKGTAGWDTLDGLAGDDKITGGAGLDTFLISSGRDTILDFNALTKGATGSEVLQVSAGATADATLKAAWTATNESFSEGTANLVTKGMAVDLSGITDGQGWNVTNKGTATTIKGSRFNDVLIGGSGNDILIGGAGNDVLAGGKGFDILTGGTGADTFRLSGDTKTDHITDFLSGTDRIELDNLVFKALLTEGQLAANQFAQGTTATTATQRIVYDQPTGNLWYDVDGSGKKAAVLMAVLDNHVQIAHTDFWVI